MDIQSFTVVNHGGTPKSQDDNVQNLANLIATRLVDEGLRQAYPDEVKLLEDVLTKAFAQSPEQALRLVGTGVVSDEDTPLIGVEHRWLIEYYPIDTPGDDDQMLPMFWMVTLDEPNKSEVTFCTNFLKWVLNDNPEELAIALASPVAYVKTNYWVGYRMCDEIPQIEA